MNGGLKYLNLLGVVMLVVLCVVQWQRDRHLNLNVSRLDQIRTEQTTQINDQATALKGLNEDLGQLKTSLVAEQSLRQRVEQKAASVESANEQLVLERDQLKEAITNWSEAVVVRDQAMKQANARIEQLADQLNASIRKYNELVTNRNAAAKSPGAAHAQP